MTFPQATRTALLAAIASILWLWPASSGAAQSVGFKTAAGPIEREAQALPWPTAAPRRTRRVAPRHPESLAAVTGIVTLQVTVGADGRVAELRPVAFTASGAVRDMRRPPAPWPPLPLTRCRAGNTSRQAGRP